MRTILGVRRRLGFLLVVAGLAATCASAQTADAARTSYLQGTDLGYVLPPAPRNESALGRRDLQEVRAARRQADDFRKRQAYEDAGAYSYDQLLPRFSEAAGTELNLSTRPVLAHMLGWLLADNGNYVGQAKYSEQPGQGTPGNRRARPYVRDQAIVPCETDYLYPSDYATYPSGHATNGYMAALLVADVVGGRPADIAVNLPAEPDRRALIMARGVRYGDNRVVCGVHHPSDVRAGRVLAQHVYDRAAQDAEFRKDLECAREEHVRSPARAPAGGAPAFSAECEARAARYAKEGADRLKKG